MTQGNAPQHPGTQPATANQYYQPNQALQAAQANQAYAQADKVRSETAVLQQQGLGMPAQAPQAPEGPNAMEVANAITSGQLDEASLTAAVQSGQVNPDVANEAMAMLQQSMQQQQQTPQGLGGPQVI